MNAHSFRPLTRFQPVGMMVAIKEPSLCVEVCPMAKRKKNRAAVTLGRLGGLAKSPAKTKAAKENILKRWAKTKRAP